MAVSEVYVDPSIAGNSGTGTSGDPYGDLQYCLDTHTRDTTDGNRINIKAGTAEVLTKALDFTTWGSPSQTYPLTFQGYTSTAGDGGIGEIDCGGFALIGTADDFANNWGDLEIHNISNSVSQGMGLHSGVMWNCYVHDCNSTGRFVMASVDAQIINCRFEDIANEAITLNQTATRVIGCYFANGTKDFTVCIRSDSENAIVAYNVFWVDGSTDAINEIGVGNPARWASSIINNSIFSDGGTGTGISQERGPGNSIVNNLVEGFSGAGGVGINTANSSSCPPILLANNSVYDCTTAISETVTNVIKTGNETLGASPFAKSGAATYANRTTYFEPQDTGSVLTGAYHNGVRGAILQASGGGLMRIGMQGGFNG